MATVQTPLTLAADATADAALVKGKHNPVDASGGARAMTLPAPAAGATLSVEKSDPTANTVTITGNIRGTGGTTLTLRLPNESISFIGTGSTWRPVADHKTLASLDGRFPIRADTFAARDGAVKTWGHSYVDGQGASDRTRRLGSVIAEALGLREQNDSISGTTFASDVSGASFVKVLQTVTRAAGGAIAGSSGGVSGLHGYASPQDFVVFMCGVNDLNVQGNSASAMAPFATAFRAALSRWRATAVFEDGDASFSYGGTWSTPSSTATNSGSGYHQATSNAATYAIVTPSDFPGGTVAIGIMAPAGAGVGARHTATVGGNTYFVDAFGVSGTSSAFVLRIPNLPAGNNTINVALSGLVTATGVDYWQHEADATTAPIVAVVKQPYPVDYSLYGSTAPGPPTNAGVDVLNNILTTVAAEFDRRVVVVDTGLNGQVDASDFASDKLHPSDKGHRRIAAAVLAAVKAAGLSIVPGNDVKNPRVYYLPAIPTGTRTKYEVGDVVRNTTPTVLGTAGSQYVTVEWRCYVGGRPGSWAAVNAPTGT